MWRFLGVALTAIAMLVAAAVPASAAESMRVTFVRHGQSEGNASGLIDTSVPGPVLTPLGQQQARDVAVLLGDNNYDAIYASTMVRTQLTAAPMSAYLGLPIQVLPGLQEIEAGVFEGTPESQAQSGYGLYPLGWTFPGVIPQIPVEHFNKGTFMPGTEQNGYVFDARVDGALQTMYDKGDRNVVVFSHGGTIMFWTMMNAKNLNTMQKLQLLQTAQLDNTDYVVIEGNNHDGWTLVNWNGQQFAPEPTLQSEFALQQRTLQRQLAASAQKVADAMATRDVTKILTAINQSSTERQFSVAKYRRAVNAEIISRIGKAVPPAPAVTAALSAATSDDVATDNEESSEIAARQVATSTSVSDNASQSRTAATEATEDATDEAKGPLTAGEGDLSAPVRIARPARVGNGDKDSVNDVVNSIRDRVDAALKKGSKKGGAASSTAGATAGSGDSGGDSDSDSDSGGSQSDAA
jgi:broad specificity phosphatase PhoE